MPEDRSKAPQARIEVSVGTENHDIESGVKKLNPILQEILKAAKAAPASGRAARLADEKFGRITFSQFMVD